MAQMTGIDLLEKDIEKYAQNYMRHLATIIGDELTEAAKNAIEDFYDDYHPRVYRRNYYNLRRNSFRRYYSNKHGGRTYVAGVIFTPETMDDIYDASTDYVLDCVLHGFHGPDYDETATPLGAPGVLIPRMKPSPLEIVEQRKEDILKNMSYYSKQAEQLAKKDKYKFII